MQKIPKRYVPHVAIKLIKILEKLISKYEEIKNSQDIRKAYLIYIGGGYCQLCNFIGTQKASCQNLCPYFIFTGKLCTEERTYDALDSVCDRNTSKNIQVKILNNRIAFLQGIVEKLKEMEG
ncbi:MAG: hypothetical protein KQ78_02115 [Candidatus Izimaplasma bacterium HR2]|nr:MAG: hypothetical protein KQ78_02115 [Candidatus Izimaplasma bacterium HR2]